MNDSQQLKRGKSRRPKRLPIVLSRPEMQALLSRVEGAKGLLAKLLYGTGMRVSEAMRLRVQDLAFDRNEITGCENSIPS